MQLLFSIAFILLAMPLCLSASQIVAGLVPAKAYFRQFPNKSVDIRLIPSVRRYQYLGCYIDRPQRAIGDFGLINDRMTLERCYDICKAMLNEPKYFGVQYTTHCFCGKANAKYAKYGKAQSEKECGMPCGDNSKDKCGGGWRNRVFRMNY